MSDTSQSGGGTKVLPPNVFQVRTKNDIAALLYYIIPLVAGLLVAYGALKSDEAALWSGVVMQFVQTAFQFARTADWTRRAIYLVLNAANVILTAYVATYNPDTLASILPILTALLGGTPAAIASQNVNTSAPEN